MEPRASAVVALVVGAVIAEVAAILCHILRWGWS